MRAFSLRITHDNPSLPVTNFSLRSKIYLTSRSSIFPNWELLLRTPCGPDGLASASLPASAPPTASASRGTSPPEHCSTSQIFERRFSTLTIETNQTQSISHCSLFFRFLMRMHRQAKGSEVFTRRKQKCVLSNPYHHCKSNGTSLLVFLDHAFISIMASRCGRSTSRVQQCTVSVDYRQCTARMQLSACTRVQHT